MSPPTLTGERNVTRAELLSESSTAESSAAKPPRAAGGPLSAWVLKIGFIWLMALSAGCGERADEIELTVGQPVTAHLQSGISRSFRLDLKAGELVDVEVHQHSVDVVVGLFDPGGRPLLELDKLTGISRPERLLWLADEPGLHRIQIVNRKGKDGEFEIIVRERRTAGAEDRQRVDAEKVFSRGIALARKDGAQSEAIAAFGHALGLWRALEDPSRQVDVLYRLGRVHFEASDGQQAIASFEKALALLDEVPNSWQQGAAHHWLGYIHQDAYELEKARDHYRKAIDYRLKAGFLRGAAQTRNNLAMTLTWLGEPLEALEQHDRVLETRRRLGDLKGAALTLHNRGRFYFHQGREAEALDDLEAALEIRRSLGDVRGQASTLRAIGRTHRGRRDLELAFDALLESLTLREASGDRRGQAVTLIEIGELHLRLERLDEADQAYLRALEISRELVDGLTEAHALRGLGRVLNHRGEPARALDHYGRAYAHLRETHDRSGQAMVLMGLAEAERQLGGWDRARSHLENALAIVEQQRTALASHTLRYSFFANRLRYYDLYVDLLMEMHRRGPSAGFDAEALAASERAKARTQLDILTDSGAELHRGADPELREVEHALERRIESAERQRQWLEGNASPRRLAAVERRLRDLFKEYTRVQARIRQASPGYAALTQPRPLSATEIQRRVLDPETLLLEFDLGPRRSFLWVVSSDTIHSFDLPPEEVITRAARRAYLALRSSHQPTAIDQVELALERMSDLLLREAAEHLADKRLLIVSEGALQYLPFAVLPAPASSADASDARPPEPLGARHEIVNMASASMLAVLGEHLQDRRPADGVVAVVADPVFELDDPRARGLSGASGSAPGPTSRSLPNVKSRRLERLSFSGLEAERILALAPPEKRFAAIGFDASRDAIVSGRLQGYRFLHFATHGELNTEYPELSRLVLSRVDATGKLRADDSLFAHEIYDLELPAELIVLSACETALGADVRGEGLLGLTQGLFYAGAARIMVSLWKVDDEATAELMARFYENLLSRGLKPAAALSDAQRFIRAQTKWSAPYYWAGFMLLGEWTDPAQPAA